MGPTISMGQTRPAVMNPPVMNPPAMNPPTMNPPLGLNPPGGLNIQGAPNPPLPAPVSSYNPNRFFDNPMVTPSNPSGLQKGSVAQQRLVSTGQNHSTPQVKSGTARVKKEKKEFYDVEVERGSGDKGTV